MAVPRRESIDNASRILSLVLTMPITRRNELQDTFAPRLVYLWKNKRWPVGIALAVAVLTYIAMWFVPEEFKTSAIVYVNRFQYYDQHQVNPNTVVMLAENPELLRAVYDDFTQKFGRKPGDFEKFVKQFEAKTEILQDTTVRKEVSPVIELTVEFRGREETRFLLESWQRRLIEKFGNFATAEARLRAEKVAAEIAQVESEIRAAEAQQARASAELAFQQKLLAEKMDLLAPAELQKVMPLYQPRMQDASNLQVLIQQPIPKPEGMVSRLARVRLQIEKLKVSGADANSTEVAQLQAEERLLSSSITQLEKEIAELQSQVAALQETLSRATREIDTKMQTRQVMQRYLDGLRTAAASYREWDGTGLPTAGDLRVLSQPVLPELRVWPKRTLVAGIAAVAAFLLTTVWLLIQNSLSTISLPRR